MRRWGLFVKNIENNWKYFKILRNFDFCLFIFNFVIILQLIWEQMNCSNSNWNAKKHENGRYGWCSNRATTHFIKSVKKFVQFFFFIS